MNRSVRGDQAELSHLKGIVALSNGKVAEALEAFELALRLRTENTALDSLASAYASLGKTDEAIRRYLELIDRFELGGEEQECWILAHYELGKLFEQRKETARAKECYQKFLSLWKEADTDLRPLADARARLERL
jgi:tetratricopeptide (TPR) repeat protein